MLEAMTNAPQQPPAGWYPDPAGSGDERYWDGVAWSQSTRDKPVPDLAVIPPPAPVPAYAPQPASVGSVPASFGWRLLGFFIDFIIIYFLGSFALNFSGVGTSLDGELTRWLRELSIWAEGTLADPLPMPSAGFWTALLLSSLLNIAVYAVYRTILLGTLSATVGQLAAGLRTVKVGDDASTRLGWGAATIRGVVGAILYQQVLIGFVNGIFAAFTRNRQTLSDMISKTQVIKIR